MNDSYNACLSRVVIQLLTARGILNFGILFGQRLKKPDGSRKESRGPHKLSVHREFVEKIHLLWTCLLEAWIILYRVLYHSLISRNHE